MTSRWGPPTWIFFHTIASKIKPEKFDEYGRQLINYIVLLCNILPCPDCANHAKQFWANVNIQNIKSKEDLMYILFVFHNKVNYRKKKHIFDQANIHKYNSLNLLLIHNIFTQHFNTHGNMALLTDSFNRKRLLLAFNNWFVSNNNIFT